MKGTELLLRSRFQKRSPSLKLLTVAGVSGYEQ